MTGPVVRLSESSGMQAEVVKTIKGQQLSQTNLGNSPTLEQTVLKNPYGPDGMLLTPKEQYNPMSTILPNAKLEQARNYLKKQPPKKKKKKEEEKKKKNFWSWLFGKE